MTLIHRFEHNQLFTEVESWLLFRIAAYAEAFGWTLLITGIAIERFLLPGNTIPVQIAGQIHGMLFLGYALASLGLYPTLRWSRKRACVALLASVPPYGSLLFELWAQSDRSHSQFQAYSYCIAYARLSQSANT
ncbi:MAG: DUF3817 domain-containing protein [Candidatus Saccharimonadales bacterium]